MKTCGRWKFRQLLPALTPPSAPLSRPSGRGDGGEGGPPRPTAHAVGYALSPAPRANIFNEFLRHNISEDCAISPQHVHAPGDGVLAASVTAQPDKHDAATAQGMAIQRRYDAGRVMAARERRGYIETPGLCQLLRYVRSSLLSGQAGSSTVMRIGQVESKGVSGFVGLIACFYEEATG